MSEETYAVDEQLKAEFIDETLELLDDIDGLFVQLEQHPDDEETVNAIFRPVHTIKGNSAFFGLMNIRTLAHDLETVLDLVRKKALAADKEVIDILLAGVQMLREMFERIAQGQAEAPDAAAYQKMLEAVRRIPSRTRSDRAGHLNETLAALEELAGSARAGQPVSAEKLDEIIARARELSSASQSSAQAQAEGQSAPAAQKSEPSSSSQQARESKTIRVAESHLDGFLESVGDLVIIGEMLRHLQISIASRKMPADLIQDFRRAWDNFNSVSEQLQTKVMSIRLVSVRSLLQKAPKLVRDIAATSGKDIKVVAEGGGVEIDKSLLDMLDTCLTHMVRNAADHGIENPDDRQKAGKNRQGVISVDFGMSSDKVTMTIADDGAGLNLIGLKAKAVALGMISAEADLSDDVVKDMLFMPGVSTAQRVTDVSGRGVGMDVVRRLVENLGGSITLTTELGKGTTFVVTVPKSVHTQIVSGMVVALGEEKYVLPLAKVRECFDWKDADIHRALERGECMLRHGRSLPVIRLGDALNRAARDVAGGIMVTVDADRKQVALAVDEVIGVQQVVLKEVQGLISEPIFAGGALMGDGRVAMFLDIEALCAKHAA
ncbi:MAG: chemotaxis protein CheA [Planctomycetes bacterium]|nr:chemotaxis protein CheA [Planctomycetota bacterium]